MKNTEIEKLMLKMGGHCQESITDIHNATSVEKLAAVLFDFIKPCMQKNWPGYEVMRHFSISGEPYGVYVDSQGEFEAKKQNVLYGNSDITLKISPFDVVRIYMKHNSRLKLKIGDSAIVLIYQFDNSTFEIIESNNPKITVRHEFD